MKVLIEIPDSDAPFALKVLKSLSLIKNAKPVSASAVELWEDLKDAAERVRLHKQGKINLKSAQELLNEL
jgi:hypothetical protein